MNTFKQSWLEFYNKVNGPWHERALWLYLVIVFGHWSEHLIQIYQIYGLGWLPADSGGILGLWFPYLAQSEILHIAYNGSMWVGLLLLWKGMKGRSKTFWNITFALQCWHLFEHLLLSYQFFTKNFLFGASTQTGIGQLWFPRAELHFAYNLIVFMPMVVAYLYYFRSGNNEPTMGQAQSA